MRYASEVPHDLYIPHGSDERLLCVMLVKFLMTFISHMVQMKASMRYASEVPHDDLYIPHGSDERTFKASC